jgi:hypothetical protein
MADANSYIPCPCPCRAVPWPWEVAFKKAWSWHGSGAAWLGVACVNETRPHFVNKMGKTRSKPLDARHGRGMGTVWSV